MDIGSLNIDAGTALVIAAGAFLIRPATAFLTDQEADKGPLGIIAGIVLAGLTAGGAALAGVSNIGDDWRNVVAVAVTALLGAGAANAQLWSGKAVDWIHKKTDQLLHIGGTA